MGLSKLHIRTFGCQMNEYDSDKMSDVLKHSHGLELTDDIDQADVLLIKTLFMSPTVFLQPFLLRHLLE